MKHFGPDVNLGNIPPDEVIPLETLRLGLRGDTIKEVLLGEPRRHSLTSTSRRCRAEDLLRWAYEQFGDRLCLTCSWQKQSSVLVHMVSELGLPIDVIELDTQLFFRESYDTRDRLVERYGLNLIRPQVITVAEQHKQEGPNLWERDPDRCCHIRKVEPLLARARARTTPGSPASAATSRRAAPTTPKLQWSERYGVWKVHPLADWDEKRVWAYITVNEIPYNPLHETGYRSIGCIPCTRPTAPDEEERAGRWAGSDKLECGIHADRLSANWLVNRKEGVRMTRAHIYAHEHPESDRRRDGGFTLWFTGLSGSGKSTIAHLVGPELDRRGCVVEYLDGDTVRTHLSKGLGFSKEDRDTNIERIGWVASRLTRQGGAVIAAAISPVRGDAAEGARDGRGVRHVRRGAHHRRRSTSAPAAT